MKRAVSFIVCVVLLLVLGAGIFFLYRYTNGFNEDFKTFYIEQDGKKILSSKSSTVFEPGSEVRFDVGYTFDGPKSEARDYSVKILPNPEEDFDFTADELYYSWRMAEGLEECFSLDKKENYFTLTIPRNSGKELLAECLRKCFPGSVDLSEAFPGSVDPDAPFFLLRVSSYNGTVTYDVAFSVADSEEGYTITFTSVPGGNGWMNSIVCPTKAKAGETVSFSWTWSSESPYQTFQGVTVTTERGATVAVSFEGGWHFTMPAENVAILVTYTFR